MAQRSARLMGDGRSISSGNAPSLPPEACDGAGAVNPAVNFSLPRRTYPALCRVFCLAGEAIALIAIKSASHPKADMCGATRDVCFGLKVDIEGLEPRVARPHCRGHVVSDRIFSLHERRAAREDHPSEFRPVRERKGCRDLWFH